MKNPESKPLRIERKHPHLVPPADYGAMLASLAVAQSNLIRAGKDSAMPHFIAIVKELERHYDFTFEIMHEKQ